MRNPAGWRVMAGLGALLLATWLLQWRDAGTEAAEPAPAPASAQGGQPRSSPQIEVAPDAARQAFERRARGQIISTSGLVERTLADDRDGSAHQRFIIRTSSGLSLLVAHNIDLAPRLEGIRQGDRVWLRGEYEWNEQGGVMHWTHHDPKGIHEAGYVEWRGRRYQ